MANPNETTLLYSLSLSLSLDTQINVFYLMAESKKSIDEKGKR